MKHWLIRRPDARFLELDEGGHWGWTTNALQALKYPSREQAEAAMGAARQCGVDWPAMHVAAYEFRPLDLS